MTIAAFLIVALAAAPGQLDTECEAYKERLGMDADAPANCAGVRARLRKKNPRVLHRLAFRFRLRDIKTCEDLEFFIYDLDYYNRKASASTVWALNNEGPAQAQAEWYRDLLEKTRPLEEAAFDLWDEMACPVPDWAWGVKQRPPPPR